MSGFPNASASRMGNLIVNPGGVTAGSLEVYLRCNGWWLLSMAPFWGFPDIRGENLVIPGVDGTEALGHLLDQGTYTTALRVTGDVNATGGSPSASNPFVQLRASRNLLFENVHTPVGVTRNARLLMPTAGYIDFEAQFKLTLGSQKGTDLLMVLDCTVPAGAI